MFATRRHLLAAAAAGALLTACQGKGALGKGEDASDMALGEANAPLTMIEYASVTCPHCREFHDQIFPELKKNYIDTGKLRFIFREFPTPPEEVAVAGFQVARCGGKNAQQYFNMLDVLFDQQVAVITAYQAGAAKDALLAIAKSSGVSEDQFKQCVSDPAGFKRIGETVKNGIDRFKVGGTPTLILNNEPLDQKYLSYDALSALLDSKLAKAT